MGKIFFKSGFPPLSLLLLLLLLCRGARKSLYYIIINKSNIATFSFDSMVVYIVYLLVPFS